MQTGFPIGGGGFRRPACEGELLGINITCGCNNSPSPHAAPGGGGKRPASEVASGPSGRPTAKQTINKETTQPEPEGTHSRFHTSSIRVPFWLKPRCSGRHRRTAFLKRGLSHSPGPTKLNIRWNS